MLRSDFQYELPAALIAQTPNARRSDSRLLVVNQPAAKLLDRRFVDLLDYLQAGDLLVVNDTRVIPARVFGRKPSGGRLELLIERVLDGKRALCHLKVSKKPRIGDSVQLEGEVQAVLRGRAGDLFEFEFLTPDSLLAYLERCGHVPLPPYIERHDEPADRERYQTVFADRPGAVAAPTAGLHFDEQLLQALEQRGVERCRITLHVGAGTFQPVRSDSIDEHRMHAEWLEVDDEVCAAVARTRERGGRVIAVGTTVVRALETAAADGQLRPFRGDSRIFIKPGFEFHCVDALVTNFHLPESTLLMLVCAFGGYDRLMQAYRHAVAERYRFFSYGDAMLLFPAPGSS